MHTTCVVVADRARARFLLLEPSEHRTKTLHALREIEALANPEGELRGNEVFSNTRSGSNRAPHGVTYEYDDHRTRHREEVERRFAKRIVSRVVSFAHRADVNKVVLVAEPHLLGLLRPSLADNFPPNITLVELSEDLSLHTAEHVLGVLVRRGALLAPNPD